MTPFAGTPIPLLLLDVHSKFKHEMKANVYIYTLGESFSYFIYYYTINELVKIDII